jgi:hypothetical protein
MIDSQWFSVSLTPFMTAFAILLVIAGAAVSVVALKRTGFKRSQCVLELMRFLLICSVALVACQPEWLQQFLPKSEPTLLVLWDQSNSMTTEDVVNPDQPAAAAISRAAAIRDLAAPEFWEPLAQPNENGEQLNVVIEPFSSTLSESLKGTDINNALNGLNERYDNLRAVVLMSDGNWNVGSAPTESATQLRMKDVPVFAIQAGSEEALPDLEVTSLDAPTFGVINKPTRIPFSISSTMAREVPVSVSLKSTDGDRLEETFTVPANGTLQSAFVWRPKKEGEYELELNCPVVADERIENNNVLKAPISIRKESLKVLIVESFPRWEYRYLRNALVRDPGVDVKSILFHPSLKSSGGGKDYLKEFPQKDEELLKFDVILLGDVGVEKGQLSLEDCTRIKGVVENQATGLILMPGFGGRQLSLFETDLKPLFPIIFDAQQPKGWGNRIPAKFQLTEAGVGSLLTKLADSAEANDSVWRSLPGFQWYAPVLRAKVGSEVLAVHATESNDNGRIPLLVTKTFGSGKILFMGTDGAWRWREGVEDKYHYRFWGQVARWMAYQRNMAGGDALRLFYSPDRPKTGQTLTLNANAMSISGEPLQSGNVSVQIVAPSGNTNNVKLSAASSEDQWGLFSGFFVPEENGPHQVTVNCEESGAQLQTSISVQGLERERIGKPADMTSLKEIALVTRGELVSADKAAGLIESIQKLKSPEAQIKRLRIWANPILAGIILCLLSCFWIGRKLAGMI